MLLKCPLLMMIMQSCHVIIISTPSRVEGEIFALSWRVTARPFGRDLMMIMQSCHFIIISTPLRVEGEIFALSWRVMARPFVRDLYPRPPVPGISLWTLYNISALGGGWSDSRMFCLCNQHYHLQSLIDIMI